VVFSLGFAHSFWKKIDESFGRVHSLRLLLPMTQPDSLILRLKEKGSLFLEFVRVGVVLVASQLSNEGVALDAMRERNSGLFSFAYR